jgi:membrane dipeptidase
MNRRDFLGASAGVALAATAPALADEQAGDPEQLQAKILDNAKIQFARQVALDVLKPNQRDLEHGLALHRESLVFESYGFAPRAAPDGDAFRAAIEAGASEAELDDLYEEMRMTRPAIDAGEQEEFKMAWEASGVTCIFQNAGEEGQDPLRLIKRLARFTYVTDTLRDFVARGVTPEDVVAAKLQNRHCMCFSGNGVPLTQDWISTHDELRYVRIFYQLGIRMMHLTYNRRNMLGDGCAEPANAGLSAFGRDAIAEMNRVGVLVDVAHSGWRTSQEAAEASQHPIVASHTTCAGLHHHIRSKPDEVIRAICDTGGYIGICCIPSFLGGKGDIGAMMDHLDYAINRFGADHVAIGTDVAYLSRNSAAEHNKVPQRRRSRQRWAYFWPPGALELPGSSPESMAWTNWPLFTVGLVQRGHSDEAIQKILGGNVVRVMDAVRVSA